MMFANVDESKWIPREVLTDALAENKALKERIEVLEGELKAATDPLAEWHYISMQRVIRTIPECPIHGECLPHAADWIEQAKQAEVALREISEYGKNWRNVVPGADELFSAAFTVGLMRGTAEKALGVHHNNISEGDTT